MKTHTEILKAHNSWDENMPAPNKLMLLDAMEEYANQFKHQPKKSLLECKDEVAKYRRGCNFENILRGTHYKYIETIMNESAELYLQSNTSALKSEIEKQKELIKEMYDMLDRCSMAINRDSRLGEEIETTLTKAKPFIS